MPSPAARSNVCCSPRPRPPSLNAVTVAGIAGGGAGSVGSPDATIQGAGGVASPACSESVPRNRGSSHKQLKSNEIDARLTSPWSNAISCTVNVPFIAAQLRPWP